MLDIALNVAQILLSIITIILLVNIKEEDKKE